MTLDPIVQSAFVIIVAWLLKLAAAAAGIEIDDTTLNTIAAAIVVFLLSKLGLSGVKRVFPGAVRRGLLKDDNE